VPERAGNRAQQRALAGAVVAEDGHDSAFGDAERHAGQRPYRAVVRHMEVAHIQQDLTGAGVAAGQVRRIDAIAPRNVHSLPPQIRTEANVSGCLSHLTMGRDAP
jgi:hypothetical protein